MPLCSQFVLTNSMMISQKKDVSTVGANRRTFAQGAANSGKDVLPVEIDFRKKLHLSWGFMNLVLNHKRTETIGNSKIDENNSMNWSSW